MELFKLLGRIIVENSEARKKFRETQEDGEKTESKLSKAFSAMGKGAAVAGKAIAIGLGAGATAMAGLTVKALQLSGDLEQNLGGAEAVFGDLGESINKMSTTIITGYDEATGKAITATSDLETVSKNAYKNMGLSQSDYLSTANKMGALLKGAGFETQEALDLSSQAMQRAADVASIMGIDTSAAMEAVAGAAKGNFTMMDNLGVAMNDTAIGAYALEKGISKSTSEMSQQEKIGLAMEMFLDKTSYAAGNYAKENETLAGSLGTAKAALTNFLAGSGDVESLVSSFSNLANVVVRSLSEIAPRLTSGLTELVNQVVPLIQPLLDSLLPVIVDGAVTLINGLVEALPGVLSALMNALPALIEGVMQIIDALIGALPGILQALLSALPTLLPTIIDGVVGVIMMLVEMLPQIIQPIIDNLPTIIISIMDALLNNLPILIQGAIQLVGALIQALPQILSALWEAIGGIFSSIGNMIGGWFEPLKNAISNAWASLGNVPGLAQLKTMIEQVWGAIKSHITVVITAIKDVVSTYWNAIKNVISTVINAIKNVISTTWNAIKTIISSVMKLISSVLKGDWEGVKSAISSILNAIKSVISSVWNGIKSVISSVLNGIKSVVSSVWNGIKSVISSNLNTIKTIVSSVWNGIKGAISGAVKGIKTTVTTGFKEVKEKVINAFKDLPDKLKSVGKNLVEGLWNGINNAKDWVLGKIKGFGKGILNGLKSFFGIKSPSRVMRDEIGKELAEGVAVGIEKNTSSAISAMEGMGKDILATAKKNLKKGKKTNEDLGKEIIKAAKDKLEAYQTYNELTAESEVAFWDEIRVLCAEGTTARVEADQKYFEAKNKVEEEIVDVAEKRLEEYATYNDLTLANEVSFWDGIRQQCTEGTDARLEADKKYFAAKKNLDKQLLDLETDLQESIINIYKKVEDKTKSLMNLAGYDEALSNEDIMKNLEKDIRKMEQWEEAITALESKIGGTKALEDIKAAGIGGALNKAYELAFSTPEAELQKYVESYDKKYALAKKMAQSELAEEITTETEKAYQTYADKCKALGVEIIENTSAMQTVAVDSFTNALEKIKSVFDNFEFFSPLFSFGQNGITTPAVVNYDITRRNAEGGTSNPLTEMIKGVVAEQNTTLVLYLKKMIEILATYFPKLLDAFDVDVYLNSGVLVGELAPAINDALGDLSNRKDRGR